MYYSLINFKVDFDKTLTRLLPALCLLSLIGCQAAQSQSRVEPNVPFQSQTLVVSGRGMVDIPKTNAGVSLGVQVQGETSGLVQEELVKRSQFI